MNEDDLKALVGRLAERLAGLAIENCQLSLRNEALSAALDELTKAVEPSG